MNVSPKWVLVILIVFGGLLLGQYWSSSVWHSKQGPDLLATDHQGNLYIGLQSTIFRYSPAGEFLGQRDLKQLGIEKPTGGIAFFPNGDLLMVPHNYQPSFLQRILMTYRITTPVRQAVVGQSGRLSRCVWDSMDCTPLPEFTREFADAFWVDVDANENIFLADTSQHQLFWLDKDGRELDRFSSPERLQFPNQIKRKGNRLWIANCNDNSLSSIALENNQFSSAISRFPLEGARLAASDRWPIGLVAAEDDFLVLAKAGNLMHGSIVRMDANGAIQDVFSEAISESNQKQDVIALAWFNGELLAADFASLTINRFSKYGAFKGTFAAPEFVAAAALYRSQLNQYQTLERYFSWLFWSLLVLGFGAALYLERRHKAGLTSEGTLGEGFVDMGQANPHFAPQASDKRIQWLVYTFFYRNLCKWLIWFYAPLIMLVLPTLFSAEEESFERNAMFLVLHCILLLQLIYAQRLTRCRLGAFVPWVFIDNGKEVHSVHERDIYSYSLLGSVVLMIGREDLLVASRGSKPIFEGNLAQDYIVRLIDLAQPMSTSERIRWLWENKLSYVIWQGLLVLLYLLALIVSGLS